MITPGRALIAGGVALVIVGLLVELAPALRLGRLPGDLRFGTAAFRVYVPLATSLLLSILLTLILAIAANRPR